MTFLISGIWHGAAWTFAIWGMLHAVGDHAHAGTGAVLVLPRSRSAVLKQAWVFAYVCFAWIFFRAASLSDANADRIANLHAAWQTPQIPALMLGLIALVWVYQAACESPARALLEAPAVRIAMATCMIVYIAVCASGGKGFIYFQF